MIFFPFRKIVDWPYLTVVSKGTVSSGYNVFDHSYVYLYEKYVLMMMLKSLDLIDLIHIVHDKLFSNGFIWYLSHHSVYCLTAEFVLRGVCLHFQETFIDHFSYSFHLTDVVRHEGHVNGLWIGLFLNEESALFERVSQFVAAEFSAYE